MPKKQIATRLQDLFTALEHQVTQPDDGVVPQPQAAETIEAPAPQSPPPVQPPAPAEVAAAPVPQEPARLPVRLQPTLYEPEQVGFAYTENGLLPLRGTNLQEIELDNAVQAALVETGQPVGRMVIDRDPSQPWSEEEQSLIEAVAQQVSLQIQSLRLLASAERSRAEAQLASRRFIHESWDAYLDGIHQNERIGYAFDQEKVDVCLEAAPADVDTRIPVQVLDEQVGQVLVQSPQDRPWGAEERELIAAVAQQVGQQVENLRLLADASRARAEAEEATRRLTRQGWKEYASGAETETPAFVYDQNQVMPLTEVPDRVNLVQPLVVRGETIGELAIAGLEQVPPEAASLMSEIAAQASIHLETLRLNEELRKRAEELQELDRLKSSFLANMSHELRTPLNSILGFSDVILEGIDGPLTDYMENDLKLIQKNGKHLLHLINDVLDMAKIESGRMNLHPEKVRLSDILNEVISITSSLAAEKDLPVVMDEESKVNIEINADVTRLRQVMINLVNNSIKFTEKGSITLRVDDPDEEHVIISVKDTGIGIPPDHLENIFQEFSQVDTSTTRKVGGTGLGLPISRQLVEMHGGRLWAESKNIPGEGSTFYVLLPRNPVIAEHIEIRSK